MKTIEFPLLSVLSVCVLLFFGLQGNIELYSLEARIDCTEGRLTIDPVFLVWSATDSPLTALALKGKYGFAIGNVIVFRENYRDHPLISFALQHETNHVAQQRSLGLWTPLAYLLGLNLEGEPYYSITPDFEKNLTAQWKAPNSWIDQWHFLTIDIVSQPPHNAVDLHTD